MFDFINLAASSGVASGAGSQVSMILMLVLMFAVMYFFMIRPQRKREKEEQAMRASLEIGDEIITIGGIIGRVVTIKDDEIVIETGADRNKMKILRTAVNTNKTKFEQHRKEVEAARQAAKEKKEAKKNGKKSINDKNSSTEENK